MTSPDDAGPDPTTGTSPTLLPVAAVQGRCEERFAAIKTLAEELAVQDDDGFAVAVEVDGELVVDLWTGEGSIQPTTPTRPGPSLRANRPGDYRAPSQS